MNIVLIIIDTLRYDYIHAHGKLPWIKTPNMDRLAERSWVFDYTFIGSFPTIPHRTDVMTGKYGDPFHIWMPLRHDVMTFPELLGRNGYCTQLIHDTPHLVNGGHNFDWPFHAWTPIRGAEVDRPWIDDSREWPSNWKLDPVFDPLPRDKFNWSNIITYMRANRKRKKHGDWNTAKLFLKACEFLRDNKSRDNFFLWLDSFDPHEPWDVPPEYAVMYDNTKDYDGTIDPRAFAARYEDMSEPARKRHAAMYAAKVSWVDNWLGKFLDTLDETGLAKRTAVILTADHGTHVGERGWGKKAPVWEQVARVPLMVSVPGAIGTGRCDAIAQPQDIFTTICGIAGVETPDGLPSNDVLATAVTRKPGPRNIALSGIALNRLNPRSRELCSAFSREWSMEVGLTPEMSCLRRMGSLDDVTSQHQDVVQAMHAEALAELGQRGIDPKLMAWIKSGGKNEFPWESNFHAGYPAPRNYKAYFARLYHGE